MRMSFIFLALTSFCVSADASDLSAFANVPTFEEALKIVLLSKDEKVLFIGSSRDILGQKQIEIRRGNGDFIKASLGGCAINSSWKDAAGMETCNVDCAKMPAGMSFAEYLEQEGNMTRFSFDDNSYDVALNTKTGDFSLSGNHFELARLEDGSTLIFLHRESSKSTREFQIQIQ